MKKFVALAACGLVCLFALAGSAATIDVNPGQSIQTAINSAVAGDVVNVKAGDYTGGVTVNKAITLRGQPGAKIHATGDGAGNGVTIAADGATVEGLYLDKFAIAIMPSGLSPRNNATIRNNHTYSCTYHLWINGTGWLVENNDFDKVIWWSGEGDADYTRMFGTGHTFRGNYLHGTNFSNDDLAPASGTDYAHTDGIQYYGNNGEQMRNCTIENNYFTDFHQGLFICDETTGSLADCVIRNNVFWGQTYTPAPGSDNFNGLPSWGICIGKFVGGKNMLVQNNLVYNCANFFGIRAVTTGQWLKNIMVSKGSGTVYDPSTTTPALVTIGNMRYGPAWVGQGGYAGSDLVANPMMANVAAPLGADGVPMTADDGWRPTLPAAAGFGPQVAVAPPANRTPVANPDAFTAIYNNSQFAQLNVLANDSDPDGDPIFVFAVGVTSRGGTVQLPVGGGNIQYRPAPGIFGTETFNYTISDGHSGAAVSNVTVTIPAPPADVTPPAITLIGANPMTIASGSTFTDPGATAVDDRDGAVPVIQSGTVNTVVAGTYTRTYTAKDAANNSATKTRTVVVAAPVPPPAMSWQRVRVYNSNGSSTGYAWVWATIQAAKPTAAP